MDGTFKILRRRWLGSRDDCKNDVGSRKVRRIGSLSPLINCSFRQVKNKPLELAHVGGIFILLAIGLAAAALSVLCEFGIKYFH